MAKTREFEIIEDYTADVAFVAYGESLEELFVNAARALTSIQVDLEKVEPKECVSVSIESYDFLGLLRKWLEELLYWRDVKQMFFSKVPEISINLKITAEGDEKYEVVAKICGEKFDPEKHDGTVEIKAVSYHNMEIGRKDNAWYARVLVDV